jgi:hypothetical protein
MTVQSWIVFSIDGKQVYQIGYNGCTGKDIIDSTIEMVAGEYKVPEDDVKVSFNDELEMKPIKKVVSSELKKSTRDNLDTIEIRN